MAKPLTAKQQAAAARQLAIKREKQRLAKKAQQDAIAKEKARKAQQDAIKRAKKNKGFK